ncbi:MAG: hypothetical protein WCJ30_03890 [Deltaproteobacteria bacterium]
MIRPRVLLLGALGLVTAGVAIGSCAPPLEQPWQLTDFRVLGVGVEPPEPARGTDVRVTLAYADVRNRPVQVVWIACTVPLTGGGTTGGSDGGIDGGLDAGTTGGTPGCTIVSPPGSPFPLPDVRTTVTVHIPATGGSQDSSGRETITLLGFACAGGSIGLASDGGTTPTCTGANARGWSFTRSIRIHDPRATDPPNANPHVSEVRFGPDGTTYPLTSQNQPTLRVCTGAQGSATCPAYVFEVGFTDGSRETYHASDLSDGALVVVQRTERITTGFAITRGTLAGAFRTDSSATPVSTMQDVFYAPETAGDIHLFVYATDGRGGFDATDRYLHVQ